MSVGRSGSWAALWRKTRFKPDMINSATTSVECDVCHARLATTTVVEFIPACGLCAKKIENLIQRRTQFGGIGDPDVLTSRSCAPQIESCAGLGSQFF